MASRAYHLVTQYPTVEFLGGTQTRQAMAVGIRTVQGDVYLEFRIDAADYTSALAKDAAGDWAYIWTLLFDIPGVDDLEWTQEPTRGGQLQDHVLVYVSSASSNSSTVLDFPYSVFTQDYISTRVALVREQMNAAEAGEVVTVEHIPVYGIDYGPPAGQRGSPAPGGGVITIH